MSASPQPSSFDAVKEEHVDSVIINKVIRRAAYRNGLMDREHRDRAVTVVRAYLDRVVNPELKRVIFDTDPLRGHRRDVPEQAKQIYVKENDVEKGVVKLITISHPEASKAEIRKRTIGCMNTIVALLATSEAYSECSALLFATAKAKYKRPVRVILRLQ